MLSTKFARWHRYLVRYFHIFVPPFEDTCFVYAHCFAIDRFNLLAFVIEHCIFNAARYRRKNGNKNITLRRHTSLVPSARFLVPSIFPLGEKNSCRIIADLSKTLFAKECSPSLGVPRGESKTTKACTPGTGVSSSGIALSLIRTFGASVIRRFAIKRAVQPGRTCRKSPKRRVENTLGGFGGKTDIFRIMPGICNRGCRDRSSCNVYIIRGRFRPWRVYMHPCRDVGECARAMYEKDTWFLIHTHMFACMHA